jgi:putative acetyltransferase
VSAERRSVHWLPGFAIERGFAHAPASERAESFGDRAPGAVALRTYTPADEDAAVKLWQRSWQQAYPHIDFSARLEWWRKRWREELVPACTILVAELSGAGVTDRTADAEIAGFVTVNSTGYLDQIVVAPEAWGSPVAAALLDAAKRVAPTGLELLVNQDNARAIRFYEKHGFAIRGEEVNPRSGAPLYRMSWRG